MIPHVHSFHSFQRATKSNLKKHLSWRSIIIVHKNFTKHMNSFYSTTSRLIFNKRFLRFSLLTDSFKNLKDTSLIISHTTTINTTRITSEVVEMEVELMVEEVFNFDITLVWLFKSFNHDDIIGIINVYYWIHYSIISIKIRICNLRTWWYDRITIRVDLKKRQTTTIGTHMTRMYLW